MKRSPAELASEVAAALMKAPRSIIELCKVVGVDTRSAAAIRRYVEQFRLSGCVFISGATPNGAPVFKWQATVFGETDVDLPDRKQRLGGRHPRVFVEVNGQRMSITQAAGVLNVKRTTLLQRVKRTGSAELRPRT